MTAIELADNVDQVVRIMDRVSSDFGSSSFSYVDIGSVVDAAVEPFFRTTVRADFIDAYMREKFLDHDPVVRRAAVAQNHFGWFDCPEFAALRDPRPGPRPMAGRILDLANDYDFFDGVVVPVHHMDNHGSKQSALVSLYFDEVEAKRPMGERFVAGCHALVMQAHERIVELRNVSGSAADRDRRIDFSVIISDRERRILTMIANDHSLQEIADKLGITRDGVNYHLQSARQRYGVSRTPAAVARAISRGDILV
ncbi:MAG: autoinducer binding domain-containing protein [Pseudomonadota bacterium]